MNNTEIEWTDRTWNPVSGCSHVSEGCRNCYAERVFPRVYGMDRETVPTPADGIIPENYIRPESVTGHWKRPRKFSDVRCHSDRLDQPLRIKKPQKIFVNSMSDLFHEDVPDAFIDRVLTVMALCPQHTFQVLTKRPERMRAYFSRDEGDICDVLNSLAGELMSWAAMPDHLSWPLPNVLLGVSVEDQKTADERIPLLLETPAAVRWISAEPLLGPIKMYSNWLEIKSQGQFLNVAECGHGLLNWVVVGGESGPHARPMPFHWVRSIRDQCHEAGVPFFLKQLSQKTLKYGFKFLGNFPEYLRIREFPEGPCR